MLGRVEAVVEARVELGVVRRARQYRASALAGSSTAISTSPAVSRRSTVAHRLDQPVALRRGSAGASNAARELVAAPVQERALPAGRRSVRRDLAHALVGRRARSRPALRAGATPISRLR